MVDLQALGCISRETACFCGFNINAALKLAKLGLVNRAVDKHQNERFWIRQPGEPSVGASSARGWIVILSCDIPTPAGKKENFFLARSAAYDGSKAMFNKLLRDWVNRIGVKWRDLISLPIEELEYDNPLFENKGGHVFFDE